MALPTTTGQAPAAFTSRSHVKTSTKTSPAVTTVCIACSIASASCPPPPTRRRQALLCALRLTPLSLRSFSICNLSFSELLPGPKGVTSPPCTRQDKARQDVGSAPLRTCFRLQVRISEEQGERITSGQRDSGWDLTCSKSFYSPGFLAAVVVSSPSSRRASGKSTEERETRLISRYRSDAPPVLRDLPSFDDITVSFLFLPWVFLYVLFTWGADTASCFQTLRFSS